MTDAHLKTLIMIEEVIWFWSFIADVVTVSRKTRLITHMWPLLLDPEDICNCTFAAFFLSNFALLLCQSEMKLIFLYLLMRRLKRFWPQSSAAGVRKRSLNTWSTSVVSVNFKVPHSREEDKLSVWFPFSLWYWSFPLTLEVIDS